MTDWMLTGLLTVLLIGVSMFPSRAEAQKGNNAVYKDASTCCQATPAFIDASVFAGNFTSPNLCLVLNYVLVNVIQVFYPGGGGWTSRPIFRSGYREWDAPPVAVSRVGRDDDGDQKILRIRSSALRVSLTRLGRVRQTGALQSAFARAPVWARSLLRSRWAKVCFKAASLVGVSGPPEGRR